MEDWGTRVYLAAQLQRSFTSLDIAAVQQSFDRVALGSDEFADLFYRKLFANSPMTRPLFDNCRSSTSAGRSGEST
jgi:hypothetical protein